MRSRLYAPMYRARRRIKACVLIVEDDACIRQMLREVLELEGYAIYGEAEHGLDGLELLRLSFSPLLVLTGHMMPVMSGLEMLEAAARDERLSAMHRYVMQTAAAPWVRGAAVLAELGVPVVAKPFTVDELLRVVERSLHGAA